MILNTQCLDEVCVSDSYIDSMIAQSIDEYAYNDDESFMESFVDGEFEVFDESTNDLVKRQLTRSGMITGRMFNRFKPTDKEDQEKYAKNFKKGFRLGVDVAQSRFNMDDNREFDALKKKAVERADQKIDRILKRRYHTPNVIMRQIARLNRWAENIKDNYEKAPAEKKGIFAKIKNLIAKAIAKLTSMLQSSRNRKKSLIYSDANDADRAEIDKNGYTGKFSLGNYKG